MWYIMKKMLIGIVVGVISGLFASGGGLLLVPVYTHILKLDEKEARATTLFCILPMVILTAILYNKSNFIDWQLGIKCAIGGIVGGLLGGKLLSKISNKYLQITFIIFLLYAGISSFIR